MSDILTYSLADGVATLALDDGKANVLSNAMFDDLGDALDRAEADKAIVVITGRPGIFSGGYNLKEMMAGPDQAKALVRRGSELAIRLMEHPQPVIAVGTGHIVAMGAFLFLASDYRIGVTGDFQVGLPETAKGLPMHSFGREIARPALSQRYFNRAFINGEMFSPTEAVEVGYLDRAVAADDLSDAVAKAVAYFNTISRNAFSINKIKARETLMPVLRQAMEDDMNIVIAPMSGK